MWLVWPPPLLPSLVLVGRELDVACVATAAVAVTGISRGELDVACVAAAAVVVTGISGSRA